MEYEIYYLCNILGVALVFIIILFHFVENDEDRKIDHNGNEVEESKETL